MAFSNLEKAAMGYILGRTLPTGTTRMAAKAALAAAVTAGRAAAPYVARGAVAAAPPIGRAVASPYVGLPLAAAAGTYGLQQYLEESGQQEAQNVRVAELMRFLEEDVPKAGKKRKSIYNKAMAKAMKAIKASPYNGKKGAITNAKKTFGMVSKTVSKVMKGKKVPKFKATGLIKRTIEKAFPRLVKPKAKRRTSNTKTTYTYRK